MLSLLVSQHKIFEQGHWKELAGKCRTDLEEIVSWVEKEMVGLGDFRDIAGYEQFRGALWLPQETLRLAIKILDPQGVDFHSCRQQYRSKICIMAHKFLW